MYGNIIFGQWQYIDIYSFLDLIHNFWILVKFCKIIFLQINCFYAFCFYKFFK